MSELLLFVKIAAAMYQAYEGLMDTFQSLTNPEPATLRDLYNGIVSLEIDVKRLEREVENASYELRREEVISITRAVDVQRAVYSSALQYSIDHPGDTAAELSSLTAANALASGSFYTFPGRTSGSPDRFDPRAALPSFLEGVITWLTIRSMNRSAWTMTSKNALRHLASRLEDNVRSIRHSVIGLETYMSYDHPVLPPPARRTPLRVATPDEPPPPEPIPTEPQCRHTIACIDSMSAETTYLVNESTDGYCGRPNGTHMAPKHAKEYLDTYYMPDKLWAIAQSWRLLVRPSLRPEQWRAMLGGGVDKEFRP